MTNPIAGLEPAAVWEHFDRLRQIPRCSGREAAVCLHILELADSRGIESASDEAGNLLLRQPGAEGRPTVVLQGHLDMVCEKNADSQHDFEQDPIELERDGDWITARGTTLGADNGIGVAMALAVLDETVELPPLEILLTVDEETGLTGALSLGEDFLTGRLMLNLDSEEEGVFYIGCAGGQNTSLTRFAEREEPPPRASAVRLDVSGLKGGHSGLDIHLGLANAVKLLVRFLDEHLGSPELRLASIDGGKMHNAIPREASAVVVGPERLVRAVSRRAEEFSGIFASEYHDVDPDVRLEATEAPVPDSVLTPALAGAFLSMLHAMPNGVVAVSRTVPGLVETSTNLAVVKCSKERLDVLTSQRSSVASSLQDIAGRVRSVGRLAGFTCTHDSAYPAWPPDPDSDLLTLCLRVAREVSGREPEVKAIHAGLECGLIGEKYPGMDMVSFGPDIRGAHSPKERVRIGSVARTYELLLAVLREIR
jgi:dipeptidase D